MSSAAFAQSDDVATNGASTQALPAGVASRYRVTYFKSNTSTTELRTATIVSITNQSFANCLVAVDWKIGGTSSVCTTSLTLAPGAVADFCTRNVPSGITTCNSTCSPALTFDEGNAIVGSSTRSGCEKIAVSARTVYTGSTTDAPVSAITDAKIVRVGVGNTSD